MNKFKSLCLAITILLFTACQSKQQADAIFFNANVYTVDDGFSKATAFAIKDNKFLAVGSDDEIRNQYESESITDLAGLAVYPGLIDGHAHFYRYSLGLQNVDLIGTSSFDEIIQKIQEHVKQYPDLPWIVGRGWDQNDWGDNTEFPTKDTLDILFPDKVVALRRIDGHALLTNQKGLDLAGINANTKVSGGEIILVNGKPSGVLVDNAIDLLSSKAPDISDERKVDLLELGQENCFSVGLTSLADAGLQKVEIDFMDALQKDSILKMRVYAMLAPSDENIQHYFSNGHYKTDYMHVRSFKIYGDGALGSRGACLIEPYHDVHTATGFLLSEPEVFDSLAKDFALKNFQMNTHAIGDSTNRLITDIYAKYLKGKNDKRWRIEHAQIVHPRDMNKFGDYNILPSVQPTHATSDMYWADERLGEERLETAYAYKDLLEENDMLVLGSDFPVEDINPLFGFHSAVARKDADNYPEDGFQMENSISREAALKGMTIWAAYGQFEEEEKGSIEAGKLADFVILDQDIMTVAPEKLRATKVLETWVGGERVFKLSY
jgi:predicted amidohydrolase YtcJ